MISPEVRKALQNTSLCDVHQDTWTDVLNTIVSLESERDALKAEMRFTSQVADNRLKIVEEMKSRAAKYKEALEKIGYAQGDGHPLALMKVAREALKEKPEWTHHHNENDPPSEAEA